ncbi:MAG: energy-coupling factor transporter transmembrane protein EcfT [Syntrophomonadaceae bacterium]|jgi:energy-coupling factor transport system permease protein|nr:energy-coupling factor transporter transmembrane protein EcfT [Syntrophomonadaceae bacterium]
MLSYREKDSLIHRLHPAVVVALAASIFILSLVFSHLLYLLGLLLAVGAVIAAAGILAEWGSYLKFSIPLVLLIMLVNGLLVQMGDTVLVAAALPGLGTVKITLEALTYGAGMGLRLLVVISAFALYTHAVHPDKMLGLLGGRGSKSILAATLATRLFPLIIEDFRRITEVQRCRGVRFQEGNWRERVRKWVPVAGVLLTSSLEQSLRLAAAMYVRGYGSGPRSRYHRELFRPRDYLVLLATTGGLAAGIWAALQGWSSYTYYPRLVGFRPEEIKMASVVTLALALPAILSWGWKKWPCLRSKI